MMKSRADAVVTDMAVGSRGDNLRYQCWAKGEKAKGSEAVGIFDDLIRSWLHPSGNNMQRCMRTGERGRRVAVKKG